MKLLGREMEFQLPSFGMENVVLWIFQTMLKFCTLNPCTILETFHLHCSRSRTYHNRRVDIKNNDRSLKWHSGEAPFTDKLYC